MKAITTTNVVKNIFFLAISLTSLGAFAQEEDKKFNFSGSADVYWKTNLTGTNEADEDGNFNTPPTSFANRSGFSLGMANLIASYEGEKVGFVADLVFGPRGEDAVFLSTGSANIVNQLYVYWNVSEKVRLTMGNFNTFLGYEVISPVGNFNYSTSYMFSYGPFSHTGLKADFTLSEDFSLMLAVMNSTDFTEINLDGSYTAGAQLGYKGQYLNLLYGAQTGLPGETFQIDYTGGFDLTDAFYLGINTTYNTTDDSGFYGFALYPQMTTSEKFSIGLRGEYFKEFDGGVGVFGLAPDQDADVFEFTLTGNYSINDLTFKPELRFDSASEDIFLDGDDEPTGSLASFLVAAVYSF
ncbi:porin [Galbibacter pacificus]|uniref:Porin n=1 Tax=Galbibacter pacificus TaxID=2996052 RepID=A0ABT6FNU3_9FLAO|nr:porin [Galbibacter pacificus]MDG3581459.1 porin [Galbibacter pacificus]MDG3584937.1 porin [Galbibacter pacificus]